MKGLIIFDEHSDVAFLDLDDALRSHLKSAAKEAGLLSKDDDSAGLDPNIILQQLVPFINSQRSLKSNLHCSFHSIQCNNGLLFCFDQVGDNVLMAINGDGDENEQFLRRKLSVLKRIITFLFGPVFEEIKPGKIAERQDRWNLIEGLMESWSSLYKEDHCYLVEAVEHLLLSPRVTSEWTDMMERAVSAFRNQAEVPVLHALLLVQTKILSIYKSRHADDLETGDILLLMVLVNYLYPLPTEPTNPTPPTGETSSSGSDQFYDSFTEQPPGDAASSRQETPAAAGASKTSKVKDRSSGGFPPSPSKSGSTKKRSVSLGASPPPSPSKSPTGTAKKLMWMMKQKKPIIQRQRTLSSGDSGLSTSYRHFSVMLRLPNCEAVPHSVHCIKIMEGFSLILVTEVLHRKISQTIHKLLELLTSVCPSEGHTPPPAKQTIEAIDVNVKKLTTAIKKVKVKSQVSMDKVANTLNKKWDMMKKNGLQTYLDKVYPKYLPADLESGLLFIQNLLRDVFRQLFLVSQMRKSDPKLVDAADSAVDILEVNIKDYREYLTVKVTRNVTLNSYCEEFPGLVHFMYIDRSKDLVAAPCLNIPSQDQQGFDARTLLKAKLWEIVVWIQEQLEDGTTCITTKYDNLYYTYLVNVQMKSGPPIRRHSFRGVKSRMLPGNINGPFYRHMMLEVYPAAAGQQSLGCCEMLCIHNGQTSTDSLRKQIPMLAGKLQELLNPVGKISHSVSLL